MSTDTTNPLLDFSGLPRFDLIQPEHVSPAIEQLIADAAGLPVVAGPVEATALGNLLVQARTHGALTGDLWDLRAQLRAAVTTARYSPHPLPGRS